MRTRLATVSHWWNAQSRPVQWGYMVPVVLFLLVLMFRPTGILGESLGKARA